MIDISKLFGKLPPFVFGYPDCFLGICAAAIGVAKGVEPTNPYLPIGFGLIALSMFRRNWMHVGYGRHSYTGKRFFTFKELFHSLVWLTITWASCRWWAMDFHIDEPWVRLLLRY